MSTALHTALRAHTHITSHHTLPPATHLKVKACPAQDRKAAGLVPIPTEKSFTSSRKADGYFNPAKMKSTAAGKKEQ